MRSVGICVSNALSLVCSRCTRKRLLAKQAQEVLDSEFEIHVSGVGGPLCVLTARRTWTVAALKVALEEQTDVPCKQQRLFLDANELCRDDVLESALPPSARTVELMLVHTKGPLTNSRGFPKILTTSGLLGSDCKDAHKALEAVSVCGYHLQLLDKDLLQDRNLVLAAVSANGMALKFAGTKWQSDREIVMAAVSRDSFALMHAACSLQADQAVVLAAIDADNSHCEALRFAAEPLRADRAIVLAAVRRHGYALKYAADTLRNDASIVRVAIAEAGEAVLKYAGAEAVAEIRQ